VALKPPDPPDPPPQKSGTRIHTHVPRGAAVVIPVAAAVALIAGGRRIGEELLLWGGVVLLLVAVSALLAYMLTTGQYPPRLSKDALELPPDDVEDTGKSLQLVQESVVELAAKVERIEAKLGIEDNETE
jgi:hypothetical protein